MRLRFKWQGKVGSVVAVLGLFVAAGCTPSTSQVVDMRKASSAWAASRDLKTLLACIRGVDAPADPDKLRQKAPWRIEALRTLHAIDRRLNYAAAEPDRHRALIEATYEEYRDTAPRDGQDRVRAWAVHLLGEATPTLPAEDFVTILAETPPQADPQGRVRLAALGALASRIETLDDDADQRQRVLYALAGIAADLQAGRITGERRDDLAALADGLRRRLTDYAAVVDLLSTVAEKNDTDTLLQVLTWNYQQLKVGGHLAPPESAIAFRDGVAYRENISMLLGLAWHEEAPVRQRSRMILAEFAPASLHAAILARLANDAPALPEDYPQLIVLTFSLERSLSAQSAWPGVRQRAFQMVFNALGRLDVQQREVIFGKMFAGDPAQLAAWLADLTAAVIGTSEAAASQYLRYVGHCYGKVSDTAAARLGEPVVRFMKHPALAIRQQVTAILAERRPVLLAATAARAMQTDRPDAGRAADYTVEVYIDALAHIEKNDDLPALRQTLKPDPPYELLGRGLARPTWATQARIAEFLDSRDPALLVTMLADEIARQCDRGQTVDARQWCLLGDFTQAHIKTLPPPATDRAIRILARGLTDDEPEIVLLTSRYLLELGVDPADITGSDAARTMAELAAPVDGRAKP